jgi:hypothetical protein
MALKEMAGGSPTQSYRDLFPIPQQLHQIVN